MKTFSERLCEGLRIRNMSAADLSRKINVAEGTISNYKKGTYVPKQNRVEEISNALNVSIPWLMGADVPMRKENLAGPTVTDTIVTFPVMGSIAAGYEKYSIDDCSGDTVEIPKSYLKGRKMEEFVVLSIDGDSMYPIYQNGDKVLVLKQSTLNNSGDIGAVIYEDYATIKKVEYVKGEDWLKLVPINPMYQPKMIEGSDLEQCHVVGIPMMLIRDLSI